MIRRKQNRNEMALSDWCQTLESNESIAISSMQEGFKYENRHYSSQNETYQLFR